MKVVVPHTPDGLSDQTLEAVMRHADEVEFVLLEDDEAYWRLLNGLWAQRQDFVLVEQDIVPRPDVFTAFTECAEPWCTFGYPYFVGPDYHGSGCVRFRSSLMHAMPDLWQRVAVFAPTDKHPARHWCTLDAYAQITLNQAGHQAHRHSPPVEHLHTTPSHGCVELAAGVITPI